MAELKMKKTMTFTGEIIVDGNIVKQLSQSFDEEGKRSGQMGEYITNKEKYYAKLKECRDQEDEFLKQMRKIEDESIAEALQNEN